MLGLVLLTFILTIGLTKNSLTEKDYTTNNIIGTTQAHSFSENADLATTTTTAITKQISIQRPVVYIIGGGHYSDTNRSSITYSSKIYRLGLADAKIDYIEIKPLQFVNAALTPNGNLIFSAFNHHKSPEFGIYYTKNQSVAVLGVPEFKIKFVGYPSAIAIGNNFITCGSINVNESQCVIFDMVDNRVYSVVSILGSEPRYHGCMVDYGNMQHVLWFGGYVDRSVILLDTLYGYHSIVTELPKFRLGFSCAKLENQAILCGGGKSTCLSFNISSSTWNSETFPSMNSARSNFRLLSLGGGKLLAIGDQSNIPGHESERRAEMYQAGKWSFMNITLPEPLANFGVVFMEDGETTWEFEQSRTTSQKMVNFNQNIQAVVSKCTNNQTFLDLLFLMLLLSLFLTNF